MSFTRGRVLGGSSSISECLSHLIVRTADTLFADYMTYTRGSDEEYNRWAALTGDASWEWKNVERYYLKVSRLH